MKYVTRSANDKLYQKMKFFLNDNTNTFIQCKQFQGWQGALEYLHHIASNYNGWIVSIDEDCFVIDESEIFTIIARMARTGCIVAGVPDGGVICHRTNSWTNVNPFFLIINADELRKKYNQFTREQIDNWSLIKYDSEAPEFVDLSKCQHNKYEPFAGFLYWLFDNTKIMFLDARNDEDNISTHVIGVSGKEFAVHTWYSREYDNRNSPHHSRINNIFNYAFNRRSLQKS